MLRILVHGFGPIARRGVITIVSELRYLVVCTQALEQALTEIATANLHAVVVNADAQDAATVVNAARPTTLVVHCSANGPDMLVHPVGSSTPRRSPLTEAMLVSAVRGGG